MKRVKRNQEEPVETSSMPQTKSVVQQLLELSAALTVGISLLFISLNLSATYIYENNQNLFDLTNQTGTTNLNSGDDQLSAAFTIDNAFTFYGTSYDSARMATNGCLHFGLGTGNTDHRVNLLPQILQIQQMLVKEGHAVEYHGGTKTKVWGDY